MKPWSALPRLLAATAFALLAVSLKAGTWTDHFYEPTLAPEWTGNRTAFQINNGLLEGQSASPLAPSPFNIVEVALDSINCNVTCWINVVAPNLHVCTKGALVLRHTGTNGYVFALHEATQTIEVYRLATHEMLLERDAKIDLGKWYYVRAELRGPMMNFFVDGNLIGTITDNAYPSGSVGLAVQDAEPTWFDDFTVSGPNVTGNIDGITPPQVTLAPAATNGVITFRFLVSAPYDYFVQASATPFSHDWESIKMFGAKIQGYEAEVSDPITNAVRFYRIEKVPCNCR